MKTTTKKTTRHGVDSRLTLLRLAELAIDMESGDDLVARATTTIMRAVDDAVREAEQRSAAASSDGLAHDADVARALGVTVPELDRWRRKVEEFQDG